MPRARNGPAQPIATATFECHACGGVAASVQLFAQPNLELGPTTSTDVAGELSLSGFLWESINEAVGHEGLQALEEALRRHSPSALYRLNQLWAPFYCPECDRCYCVNHWRVTRRFDDDFPGWYDSAAGICPQGHSRLLDD